MQYPRINTPNSTHLYTLTVIKDNVRGSVDVEARNRDQAARIAQRAGYEVHDVNMVG
jgi:hypothetical protein